MKKLYEIGYETHEQIDDDTINITITYTVEERRELVTEGVMRFIEEKCSGVRMKYVTEVLPKFLEEQGL